MDFNTLMFIVVVVISIRAGYWLFSVLVEALAKLISVLVKIVGTIGLIGIFVWLLISIS
jgi:flagellar motor component MotA